MTLNFDKQLVSTGNSNKKEKTEAKISWKSAKKHIEANNV